eukprot:Ihof_evm1s91 gene=Ihof_evmTU1s91
MAQTKVEVEMKFQLTSSIEDKIKSTSIGFKEKEFVDVYYDTANSYQLSSKDWWLRQRGGAWQLKFPNKDSYGFGALDVYVEVEKEKEIREQLLLSQEGDMKEVVGLAGYAPFATIKTVRTTYIQPPIIPGGSPLTVDCDKVTYSDHPNDPYQLSEVELLIDQSEDPKIAHQAIITYLETLGVESSSNSAPTEGK